MKSYKLTARILLLSALACGGAMHVSEAYAVPADMQQSASNVKGTVKDLSGEPLTGASVVVVGTTNGTTVDLDGNFSLSGVKKGAKLKVSYIGYNSQIVTWDGGALDVVLEEAGNNLGEAVVTAMGIVRKQSSLTYATQQLKADDMMKVEDVNLVNNLQGKVAGMTITQSAGGAGGASKIVLRGSTSINGSNDALIVIDGIPMNNSQSGQISDAGFAAESRSEGGDPLSQLNPDDIESINVLKGANAAALYGSAAANGVVMITTKKGKEGKLDVNFTTNVTFDTPLTKPEIQNTYGGTLSGMTADAPYSARGFSLYSWGEKLGNPALPRNYTVEVPTDDQIVGNQLIHLRNYAEDDISNFLRTGVTTNNSISLSGGTEKIKTYFSYANSYSNGMLPTNSYNRNTFAFRQNYKLWDRLTIDANINYVTTKTKNRVGGGTVGNPMFDIYLMTRNIDLGYYKDNYRLAEGHWLSNPQTYYEKTTEGTYAQRSAQAELSGPMQNWAHTAAGYNNPYWSQYQNSGVDRQNRLYGSLQANIQIWDGLSFQARASLDQSWSESESKRYATTWLPATLDYYGGYFLSNSRVTDLYTDYLLSYNKVFKEDWSVSATAGYVGHTTKGLYNSVTHNGSTTVVDYSNGIITKVPDVVNYFEAGAGYNGAASRWKSSNWDQAAIVTAQFGWKESVYIDGSYRRDWYRAFRQFKHLGTPESFGYFGIGANAIISNLVKLPEQISYLKYRVSYSEVGNSIPNAVYNSVSSNLAKGTATVSGFNTFKPMPETTRSFETGIESQFFNNALNFDITYYNAAMHNSYLTIAGKNGKTQPVNTGRVRNQGIEMTIGYDWMIGGGWRWKTSLNYAYNKNKVEETYTDANGNSQTIDQNVANGVKVRYAKGGEYGDMYVSDYNRWDDDVYGPAGELLHKKGDIYVEDGHFAIQGSKMGVREDGSVYTKSTSTFDYNLGNMNSRHQLSWSNTFSYKDFTLYFLISGRIGGKVISLTEAYLDRYGVSQRSADARDAAIAKGLMTADGRAAMYMNGGRDLVAVEDYYQDLSKGAADYVYNATNFRLRELSFGYTFRDLLGEGKNLSLSFVGRNLFFIYKDAPVDPDISLATGNGLGGFEMFNLPASRSFGFNLKLNF